MGFGADITALNTQLSAEGLGRARLVPCTEGCVTPCSTLFEEMPGIAHSNKWSGEWFCTAAVLAAGARGDWPPVTRRRYDWNLGRGAAFETNVLSNLYGLNQYDLYVGMVPWLASSQREGLISQIDGVDMDWDDPAFWSHFLHTITYRHGQGDVLAEGGWLAAQHLRVGESLAAQYYPGWGHAGHWDGHMDNVLVFPYWLVSVLQWLSDTRDPFDSGHGYLRTAVARQLVFSAKTEEERRAAIERVRALGDAVYGDADAVDPTSGFTGKAKPAFFHTVYPVILDGIPLDDLAFPLTWDAEEPKGLKVLRSVDGLGDVQGTDVERNVWAAGTGLAWDQAELERAAQRVVVMERALQVRHWGRDRALDESVLPYFEQPEMGMNPLLGARHALDRGQFAPVLDEFYALHGWDNNGRPTQESLDDLGIGEVYAPMVEGAERAEDKASPA